MKKTILMSFAFGFAIFTASVALAAEAGISTKARKELREGIQLGGNVPMAAGHCGDSKRGAPNWFSLINNGSSKSKSNAGL